MARNLKPIEVSRATDYRKRYDDIAIMLNRNTKEFFADFGVEHFSAPSAKEVEDWAKTMFSREAELDWKAVIDVSFADLPSEYRQGHANAEINIDRYFICRTPEGRFLKADWGNSEDGVISTKWNFHKEPVSLFFHAQVAHHLNHTMKEQWNVAGTITLPYLPEPDSTRNYGTSAQRTAILPYTPETWNGLCLLVMTIRNANNKIYDLITAADSIDRLNKAGGPIFNLLTSGEDEGDESV